MLIPDVKQTPYWWEGAAPPEPEPPALPTAVDVLVVGAGYTGLNAALQTARGGFHTLVLDAEAAGWGCSSRNGGQISTSVKPTYAALAKRHGAGTARAILEEGATSLRWIGDFIEEEGIDCAFRVVGRFHGAHSPARFERLAKAAATQIPGLEEDAYPVPRSEQQRELGTDVYFGGIVFPRHASVDPARYHRGLLERVTEAGATVVPHCRVTGLERQGDGFSVRTPNGPVQARRVIIATNGYTGALTPWHRRRVIPIGSYMIATEPIAPDLMDKIMPTDRIISDTRKVVYYYRPSPDRTRILFGGRVCHGETDLSTSATRLHKELARLFPDLAHIRVSHSWMDFVGYTFDTLMHVGEQDGLHYALGYCGAGVGMASYLGMRVGQQVLGLKAGRTAFDGLAFPTRPFYSGRPWFVAPTVMAYRLRDRLGF